MSSGIYSGIYPPTFFYGFGSTVKLATPLNTLVTGASGNNTAPRPTEGQLFPRGIYSRQNT